MLSYRPEAAASSHRLPFGLIVAVLLSVVGCERAPQDGAARAEHVYSNCVTCHGENGTGSQLAGAPPLAGLDQWYLEAQMTKFKDGRRGAHPDDVGGMKMRAFIRTLHGPNDISLLAEYLSQMPSHDPAVADLGGDAAKGKTLYATCTACHGMDAKGMQALNAPNLNGLPGWYMVNQLKNFKAGIRGSNGKDSTGAQMRAMTNTLVDEQAMKDVVAHIESL